MRVATPMPPANAKANGTNAASRRDCDRETTSEKRVNSGETSTVASTASEPPTTKAPQRLPGCEPGERHEQRAPAIATAPERASTGSARWKLSGDETTSWVAYCRSPRARSAAPGSTEAVSRRIGEQPEREAAGRQREGGPGGEHPSARSWRAQPQRTTRKPANGISTNSAYVGCTTTSARPAAAVVATRPRLGARTVSMASAIAAGASSRCETVAGSASDMNEPP